MEMIGRIAYHYSKANGALAGGIVPLLCGPGNSGTATSPPSFSSSATHHTNGQRVKHMMFSSTAHLHAVYCAFLTICSNSRYSMHTIASRVVRLPCHANSKHPSLALRSLATLWRRRCQVPTRSRCACFPSLVATHASLLTYTPKSRGVHRKPSPMLSPRRRHREVLASLRRDMR